MKAPSSYAGIGSRSTPPDVLSLMEAIAIKFSALDYTLRSGHAPGADQAFERGAGGNAEIYLPWPSFEAGVPPHGKVFPMPDASAYNVAAKYHPAWDRCSRGARMLHARNSHQVLGQNLDDPVEFVVCWSDGAGGTEQALRIAADKNIPVDNLYDDATRALYSDWVAWDLEVAVRP